MAERQRQTNSDKLDEILNVLAERKHLDDLILKHDEFINGNGRPGAKTQLQIISNSQKKIGALNAAIITALVIDIFLGLMQ